MPTSETVKRGGARKLRTMKLSDGRTVHVYVVPKPAGSPTTRKRDK